MNKKAITILAAILTGACTMQMAAQDLAGERFPVGSYSPSTNINRNGYPRVLHDASVMFQVRAPQAQSVHALYKIVIMIIMCV